MIKNGNRGEKGGGGGEEENMVTIHGKVKYS